MKKSFLITFLIIYTVLFGLLHNFVFTVTTRSLDNPLLLIFIKALFILGLISIPLGMLTGHVWQTQSKILSWIGYIWMGFFTIVVLFTFIEFFIYSFFDHDMSYWSLIVSFCVSSYALWNGLKPPSLVKHKIKGPTNLIGFKVAQISDVHLGMLNLNKMWFEKVLHKINKENPDVLTITGDMTDAPFSSVQPILQAFLVLEKKIKTFYITGNHEYINPGPWESEITQFGIDVLHNSNHIFKFKNAHILFAGVPDISVPRFRPELNSLPDKALQTNEHVDYRILLAHQPGSVYQIQHQPCDLLLSGHTHGGQIFPFHIFVRMANPLVKGFKTINSTLVFNHQGTGFWGPPMRWFSKSEIVILEWI